jgi:hypothetical protein
MSLARLPMLLVALLCSLTNAYAQTEGEDIRITYDRFENVTTYSTPYVRLYEGSLEIQSAHLQAVLSCPGDTGEFGCRASGITLQFDYWWDKDISSQQPPFDYRNRSVIVIADGTRIPLGQLELTSANPHNIRINYGLVTISPATLRRLARAQEVQVRVGILETALPKPIQVGFDTIYSLIAQGKETPNTPPRKGRRQFRRQ